MITNEGTSDLSLTITVELPQSIVDHSAGSMNSVKIRTYSDEYTWRKRQKVENFNDNCLNWHLFPASQHHLPKREETNPSGCCCLCLVQIRSIHMGKSAKNHKFLTIFVQNSRLFSPTSINFLFRKCPTILHFVVRFGSNPINTHGKW